MNIKFPLIFIPAFLLLATIAAQNAAAQNAAAQNAAAQRVNDTNATNHSNTADHSNTTIGANGTGGANGADDFDPSQFNPAQFIEYERQLNVILKTRRDEEKLFVAQVVDQVRIGKIPSKLVDTSYQWVRNKRPDTNYPFLYFEKVLRLQAGKLSLEKEVPPFDFSIYGSAGQRLQGQNGFAGQRTAIQRAGQNSNTLGRSPGQIR